MLSSLFCSPFSRKGLQNRIQPDLDWLIKAQVGRISIAGKMRENNRLEYCDQSQARARKMENLRDVSEKKVIMIAYVFNTRRSLPDFSRSMYCNQASVSPMMLSADSFFREEESGLSNTREERML